MQFPGEIKRNFKSSKTRYTELLSFFKTLFRFLLLILQIQVDIEKNSKKQLMKRCVCYESTSLEKWSLKTFAKRFKKKTFLFGNISFWYLIPEILSHVSIFLRCDAVILSFALI